MPAAREDLAADGQLLGVLIDTAHTLPPGDLAGLVAREAARVGLVETTIFLQDYDQQLLMPLHVADRDDPTPEPVDGSLAGRAFGADSPVEGPAGGGRTRLWLPLLDGTDRVGVMAVTVDVPSDRVRELARRLAGLVADLLVTKGGYTDHFFAVRRRRPMSIAAEMQWHLLPPLTMTTPRLSIAGMLQPAYEVGGDAFDYALNGETLHLAVLDAVGHGLAAAIMAGAAIGAYRHARRAGVTLHETYAVMDDVMRTQFSEESFATVQLAEIDLRRGLLRWVNAGHPRPLLVRDARCVRSLQSSTTLPVGFGGETPQVAEERLAPGDRVLFFTDGVVEGRSAGGQALELAGLVDHVERAHTDRPQVAETVRRLSGDLLDSRGGTSRDDATLLLVEWTGA